MLIELEEINDLVESEAEPMLLLGAMIALNEWESLVIERTHKNAEADKCLEIRLKLMSRLGWLTTH